MYTYLDGEVRFVREGKEDKLKIDRLGLAGPSG